MVSAVRANPEASIRLFAEMVTAFEGRDGGRVSIDEHQVDGSIARARVTTSSGDTYRVTVEWLSEESP